MNRLFKRLRAPVRRLNIHKSIHAGIIAFLLMSGAIGGAFYASRTAEAMGILPVWPQEPRLFASPEMLKALGPLADYLPRWSGTDVMVIGAADLGVAPTTLMMRDFRDAFDLFASKFEQFPAHLIEKADFRVEISRAAAMKQASSYPLQGHRGENGACIIAMPSLSERDPRRVAAPLAAGIDWEHIENLPGTADEWRLFIIGHEAAHCDHALHDDDEPSCAPHIHAHGHNHAHGNDHDRNQCNRAAHRHKTLTRLRYEIEGDQAGIDAYVQTASALYPKIDDVNALPRAVIELRAVSAMLIGSVEYATAPLLLLPGEEGHTPASWAPADIASAKMRVQNTLLHYARYGHTSGVDYERPIGRLGRGRATQMYHAAVLLGEQGHFDDDPLAQLILTQFKSGAENFFPGYFNISGR